MPTHDSHSIVRHLHPASADEPWAREFAQSIEVPAHARQLMLSGVGPRIINAAAEPGTVQAYGDTAQQTSSVIEQIKATLHSHGYQLSDIVTLQALLVAPPGESGVADFDGFSRVYNLYFGTVAQPNVPARTRAQVVRLVPPGWLVEITATAIKAG